MQHMWQLLIQIGGVSCLAFELVLFKLFQTGDSAKYFGRCLISMCFASLAYYLF